VKAVPKVTIVMSTYNGGAFLAEQLESVIAQTYSDWSLLIRDDGSTDDTAKIVEEFSKRDSRIRRVFDSVGNLGPARSFFLLLGKVESPLFMCCDQDDVWLSHKVEEAVRILDRKEPEIPRLLFTELEVVNADLSQIAASFMKYQKFDPRKAGSLRGLLMQNVIVGCTVAGNAALLTAMTNSKFKTFQGGLMHDWWLGLVAAAFGEIEYSSRPSLLYRQHARNSLGAPGSNFSRYVRLLIHAKPWMKASIYLSKVALQCEQFGMTYCDSLNADQIEDLNRVTALRSSRSILPFLRALSSGLRMHGVVRNVALTLSILVCPTSRNGFPASWMDNVKVK
jgi:glycosyltransferase involved in cell wall biosynthesis